MKMISVIFVAVAVCVSGNAFAEDILLTNGRLLKDASIKSEAPRSVIIWHEGCLSTIDKVLLPPRLLALYPIDEAAAVEQERRSALAREAGNDLRKKEAERLALLHQQYADDVAQNEASQAKDAAAQKAAATDARKKASALAHHYFYFEYARGSGCDVTISEVSPIEGSPKRWLMRGSVAITRHSREHVSDTSQIGDPEWRKKYQDNNKDSEEQNRNRLYYPTVAPYIRPASATVTVPEVKEFELTYSTEGDAPTVDITVR